MAEPRSSKPMTGVRSSLPLLYRQNRLFLIKKSDIIYKLSRFSRFLKWKIRQKNRSFFLRKANNFLQFFLKKRFIWRKVPNFFFKQGIYNTTPDCVRFIFTLPQTTALFLNLFVDTFYLVKATLNKPTLTPYSVIRVYNLQIQDWLVKSWATFWIQPFDKAPIVYKTTWKGLRINKLSTTSNLSNDKFLFYRQPEQLLSITNRLYLLLRAYLRIPKKFLTSREKSWVVWTQRKTVWAKFNRTSLFLLYAVSSRQIRKPRVRFESYKLFELDETKVNSSLLRKRIIYLKHTFFIQKWLTIRLASMRTTTSLLLSPPPTITRRRLGGSFMHKKYLYRYKKLQQVRNFNLNSVFKLKLFTKDQTTILALNHSNSTGSFSYINTTPPKHKQSFLFERLVLGAIRVPTSLANVQPFAALSNPYSSIYLTSVAKRFFEFYLNSRVSLFINFEMFARLSITELVFLETVKLRLRSFNYQFSTIFFLNEFIDIIFLAFKLKNFKLLIDYLNKILKVLTIWDHKTFLLFFFNIISEQMYPLFKTFNILGFKVLIKGKVGVGGNSRKRLIILKLGKLTTTRNFVNTYTMNTWLNTATGALGFRIVMFYTNR